MGCICPIRFCVPKRDFFLFCERVWGVRGGVGVRGWRVNICGDMLWKWSILSTNPAIFNPSMLQFLINPLKFLLFSWQFYRFSFIWCIFDNINIIQLFIQTKRKNIILRILRFFWYDKKRLLALGDQRWTGRSVSSGALRYLRFPVPFCGEVESWIYFYIPSYFKHRIVPQTAPHQKNLFWQICFHHFHHLQ